MAGRFGNKGAALLATAAAIVIGLHMTRLTAGEPARLPQPPATAKPAAAIKPVAKPPVEAAPLPQPAGLVVKRILPLDGPIKYGEFHWDDAGVPEGPLTITVDLDAETMSVFRDGYEIGATAILYGAEDKPTPLGVYPITQKDADHVSNLYGSPMPYMLRLTNDGISIHGSEVEWGFATHGCIGVPVKFARLLFKQAKLGDHVIITNGKRLGVGGLIAPKA